MIESIEVINKYKDYFTYRWNVTKFCNYRCSYCFQKHDTVKPTTDALKEQAAKILDLIKRTKDQHGKKIRLSLMGGEISIFPLAEILEPFMDYIDELSFVSNGSGDFTELITLCKNKNVHITGNLSYHEEFTTPEKFTDKIMELKKLNTENNWFVLGVITNYNYVKMYNLYKICKEKHIGLSINLERSSDGSSDVLVTNKKCLEWIKQIEAEKNKTGLLAKDGTKFIPYSSRRDFMAINPDVIVTGWQCDLSTNMVTIEDGMVFTSFCYRKNTNHIEDFTLDLNPVICCRKHCALCYPMKTVKVEDK